MWGVRAGVQVSRKELHIHIHLDQARVEILSCIKKKKEKEKEKREYLNKHQNQHIGITQEINLCHNLKSY